MTPCREQPSAHELGNYNWGPADTLSVTGVDVRTSPGTKNFGDLAGQVIVENPGMVYHMQI